VAQSGYVFIVGLPRTGTTLMRSILNCSEDVAICDGESHYLGSVGLLGLRTRPGFWHQFTEVGDISTDEGAKKVVDYIYGINRNVFWSLLRKNVDREEFLRRLLESDRSEKTLLSLALTFCAGSKPIRGEKTPAHIYHVPTLLDWFPNAKIIHMFRDPRAVYVSLKKKPRQSEIATPRSLFHKSGPVLRIYSSLHVIVSWLHCVRLHYQYQQRYPENYYFCKYEDLILDPKSISQGICDFLGISFNEAMLQQAVVNSSFASRGDKIKGFDASAIERWRKHLHPVTNYWFVMWCRKQFLVFGYAP